MCQMIWKKKSKSRPHQKVLELNQSSMFLHVNLTLTYLLVRYALLSKKNIPILLFTHFLFHPFEWMEFIYLIHFLINFLYNSFLANFKSFNKRWNIGWAIYHLKCGWNATAIQGSLVSKWARLWTWLGSQLWRIFTILPSRLGQADTEAHPFLPGKFE